MATDHSVGNKSSGEQPGTNCLALFVVVFLTMVGGCMINPVIPHIAVEFGASATALGFLHSAFAVSQCVGLLVMGYMSDTLGRERLLFIMPIAHVVAHTCSGASRNLEEFLMSRIALGMFAGLWPIISAMVMDATEESERSGTMGKLQAVQSLGAIFGPILGALMSETRSANIFVIPALIAMLIWIVLVWSGCASWSKACRPQAKSEDENIQASVESPWTALKARPLVFFWFLLCFAIHTSTLAFGSMAPLMVMKRFGFGKRELALQAGLAGASAVASFCILVKPLDEKVGKIGTCIFSLCGVWCCMPLFSYGAAPVEPWLSTIILSAMGVLSGPPMAAAVSSLATDKSRGTFMAVLQACESLGRGVGPMLGASLHELNEGYTCLLLLSCNIVLIVACCLVQFFTSASSEDKVLGGEDTSADSTVTVLSKDDGSSVPLRNRKGQTLTNDAS